MPDDAIPGRIPEVQQFRTTHWSVVLRASRSENADEAHRALEELCRAYWYPIYAFIRRRGTGLHDAQDLTQAFFEKLLEKQTLAVADRQRGRFRTFLLSALNNFLINEARDAKRLKRGGGAEVISLDLETAEQQLALEPVSGESPERVYERNWVEVMMRRVLDRLQADSVTEGQAERFSQLRVYLVGEQGAPSFTEMANRLGLTEAAVKGLVRRLRARYRLLFREEIAQTLGDDQDIDAEIKYLLTLY